MGMTTIKRNLVSPNAIGEAWLIQFYSDNASTAQEILGGVAGTRHYITQLHVTSSPGTGAKYWVLIDNNNKEITPKTDAIDYSICWKHKYMVPLPCETGQNIRLLNEHTTPISGIMEGFSRVEDPFKQAIKPQASSSTSASPSGTPSASLSPSVSSTPSVSTSVSASVSASLSPSSSVSASPSTSMSASPSWSG